MRIELSIDSSYLSNWGMSEGVREIVQNAKDGDVDGFSMEIFHSGKELNVINHKAKLLHKALLVGHTTKRNRNDQIGKFGEGLKLGILALIRAGYNVEILSNHEKWIPQIELSQMFQEEVLVFYIKEHAFFDGIKVSIDVSKKEWEESKEKFLFMQDYEKISCRYDLEKEVLLDNKHKGKIFVKGIFVQEEEGLRYGYNLDLNVDRDRHMVRNFDLNISTSTFWCSLANYEQKAHLFYNIVKHDFKDISKPECAILTSEVKDQLKELWEEDYGEMYPVSYIEEKNELENAGLKCIVVPETFAKIMRNILGSPEDLLKKIREKVVGIYNINELTEDEKETLNVAQGYVEKTFLKQYSLIPVEVGQFKEGSDVGGMFLNFEKIVINRKILKDFYRTVQVLIHEYSHVVGADGTRPHTNSIEIAWAEILKFLIEEK